MRDYSSQKIEIETIKPRTITVNLSNADVKRLAEKSGEGGLTISELLENFIGDLVDGTYSNGSDERMYAEELEEDYSRVVCYGMSFYKKRCLVKKKQTE